MTSADTHDDEAQALAQDLAEHPTVEAVETDESRRPHRVKARLTSAGTPDGVQDILEQHQASIETASIHGSDGLVLNLRPQAEWKPAGQRTIRAHGGSIVCTLTREALEASGLGEDDEVDLEARAGQVRITRRDA